MIVGTLIVTSLMIRRTIWDVLRSARFLLGVIGPESEFFSYLIGLIVFQFLRCENSKRFL